MRSPSEVHPLTLAALEALPHFIERRLTRDLVQIVYGLRRTSRSLQSDAIYKALAHEFPTLPILSFSSPRVP